MFKDEDIVCSVSFAVRHTLSGLIYKENQGESFIFSQRFIEEPIWDMSGEAVFPIEDDLDADTEV